MPPRPMTPPNLDQDAERWLAAFAARVEDDEVLLSRFTDEEVEESLATEDLRVSGVAAAIRRRQLELEDSRSKRSRTGVVFVTTSVWGLVIAWLTSPSSTAGPRRFLRQVMRRLWKRPR